VHQDIGWHYGGRWLREPATRICQSNFKLCAYRGDGHEKGRVVMKFLRTVSTQRLLALIGTVVVVIAAGTAIAVAAGGNGPVPARKRLASAIRSALAAPPVKALSARIQFTDHLIDASDIQGSDPLLDGATGRLWISKDHGMRLELQGDNGDAQVVVSNRSFWIYDPSSNIAYEGRLPAHDKSASKPAKHEALPSLGEIQTDLNKLAAHMSLSGAIPSDVAGQPTYTVRVSPKHDAGLLGNVQLAWDAVHGIPLRFAIYAQGDSSPVIELKVTNISYGSAPKSAFAISPPAGAKVVKISTPPAASAAEHSSKKALTRHKDIQGVAAVARKLPFKLHAKSKLIGLPRQTVSLLDWGGQPAALVTYGRNLGGIVVIEQTATKALPSASASGDGNGDQQGVSLPTVSIDGATGQELDTALGTIVRFTSGGVTYTVLGSVPPAAAELAARSL
jgi:outer membrane lipoprotein-sorting protein